MHHGNDVLHIPIFYITVHYIMWVTMGHGSQKMTQYVWFYQPMTQQLMVDACSDVFADSAELA